MLDGLAKKKKKAELSVISIKVIPSNCIVSMRQACLIDIKCESLLIIFFPDPAPQTCNFSWNWGGGRGGLL